MGGTVRAVGSTASVYGDRRASLRMFTLAAESTTHVCACVYVAIELSDLREIHPLINGFLLSNCSMSACVEFERHR